jgi:PDZ domain-containing protein
VTNPATSALAALSRRVRTLLVAAIVFLGLLILAMTLPVPYVILSPGPTYNTLGTDDKGHTIIVIKGGRTRKTSGNLNMTTVLVSTQRLNVFNVLSAWLQSDEVVVPRSSIYPPGSTQNQVDQQNAQDFTQSQDDAIAAASCELGYPKRFGVVSVIGGGAALGKLRPSDEIKTLDGKPADSDALLRVLLAQRPPGASVSVGILRTGKPRTVRITLGPSLKGRSGGSIGIAPGAVCQLPFTVDLGLGNQIGGPSAGLMFALGIMDKTGTRDLTDGRFVAGTGTIDASGSVGPIGGIQLKMIAARRAGATVFLAPVGNCSEAKSAVPAGLDVVRVDTLHHAVQYLADIEQHRSVPHC